MPGPGMYGCNNRRRLLATVLLLPLVGCSSISGPTVPTRFEPQKAAEAAMTTNDTNSDGQISGAELDRCLSLKSAISFVDTNRDRAISADEIAQRMEAYKSQSTFVGMMISVAKGGRPIADATVTLTPEPFMGEGFQAFAGKTDERGRVSVAGQDDPDTPGVPPGFYQVQIAPPSGGEVVLGCEVSDDWNDRLSFSL